MNHGDTYDVPSLEFAPIGNYSVVVLTRRDGRMLNLILALANISEISESPQPADQNG